MIPRRWGFVFAIARTWKTVEDKAIKDLVTHLPRKYYQRDRGCPASREPRAAKPSGCIAHACVCDTSVTSLVVLSKRGRNLGPKHTKSLVTNLDEWTPATGGGCVSTKMARGANPIGNSRRTWDWVHTR